MVRSHSQPQIARPPTAPPSNEFLDASPRQVLRVLSPTRLTTVPGSSAHQYESSHSLQPRVIYPVAQPVASLNSRPSSARPATPVAPTLVMGTARPMPTEPVTIATSQRPDAMYGHAGSTVFPGAAVAIDLNRDGKADFILAGVDLNRDGIPDFLQQNHFSAGNGAVYGVDINGDGRADFVVPEGFGLGIGLQPTFDEIQVQAPLRVLRSQPPAGSTVTMTTGKAKLFSEARPSDFIRMDTPQQKANSTEASPILEPNGR